MTRLIIQIPAYNEIDSLPGTLDGLPRSLPGVDEIVVVVVDDGSTDGTAQAALDHGADYVLRHRRNRGLSKAFLDGIQLALALGADVIVNTDADHQYPGSEIENLIAPILDGSADLVVGDRQLTKNEHFSPFKRFLEYLGSGFVRRVSNTNVPDAASGFRAFSRHAALPLQVYNPYSYTLETLIQAGKSRMKIESVPIKTNAAQRESRLHKGMLNFIWRQGGAIIRSYILYQPLRTFLSWGAIIGVVGLALLLRFVYFYFATDTTARYLQSVSIGGTLLLVGIILVIIGFLADSMRANRELTEETLVHQRDAARIADPADLREFLGQPVYTRRHPFIPTSD